MRRLSVSLCYYIYPHLMQSSSSSCPCTSLPYAPPRSLPLAGHWLYPGRPSTQGFSVIDRSRHKYEVEGPRPRGRKKRTWAEVVEKGCQARKLNKGDALDRSRWRKLINDVWWTGWVWVGECFFCYRPTRVVPDKRPLNSCVCVCVCVRVRVCVVWSAVSGIIPQYHSTPW